MAGPKKNFEEVQTEDVIYSGVYDELSNVPSPVAGQTVRITGNGTDAEGIYHRRSDGVWSGPFKHGAGKIDTSSPYRLNSFEEVKRVVTPNMVSHPSMSTTYPKEPSAVYHQGQGKVYLSVTLWNAYGNSNTTNKEVVLLRADSPEGPFTQISVVTDTPNTKETHASGLYINDNDELWVLVSDDTTTPSSISGFHQPIDNIGSNAADWTKEPKLITDNSLPRDPDVRVISDRVYVWYFDEGDTSGFWTKRRDGADIQSLSNEVEIWDGGDHGGGAEAAVPVPKGDGSGEAWMIATGRNSGRFYERMAQMSSMTATSASEHTEMCDWGDLYGLQGSWFHDWTSHFDVIVTNGNRELVRYNERLPMFFEAGDGSTYSVGYASVGEATEPPRVATFDDFSDGDISEYTGDTAAASVQTGIGPNGGNAVRFDLASTTFKSISSSTLSPIPAEGDRLTMWYRWSSINQGSDVSLYFFAQTDGSNPNSYVAKHNPDTGMFKILNTNGNVDITLEKYAPIEANTWYGMTAQRTKDGLLRAEVHDLDWGPRAVVHAYDNSYTTASAVGYGVYTGQSSAILDIADVRYI